MSRVGDDEIEAVEEVEEAAKACLNDLRSGDLMDRVAG